MNLPFPENGMHTQSLTTKETFDNKHGKSKYVIDYLQSPFGLPIFSGSDKTVQVLFFFDKSNGTRRYDYE